MKRTLILTTLLLLAAACTVPVEPVPQDYPEDVECSALQRLPCIAIVEPPPDTSVVLPWP